MARAQSDQEKDAAKARRRELHAQRRESERQAAGDTHARRLQQLEDVVAALQRLEQGEEQLREISAQRSALAHHLEGLYDEVDKLTKGKALVPVTDLLVDEANAVVREAKSIIKNDAHLDRVKEFVPAGDNPVYPDVLLTLRSLRTALDRSEKRLDDLIEDVEASLSVGRTIEMALRLFLEQGDPEPNRFRVGGVLGEDTAEDWFMSYGEKEFRFELLDQTDLASYLSSPDRDSV